MLPSQAEAEWLDHGDQLEAVMEALSFSEIAQMVIDGSELKVIPDGAMKDLALTIRKELDEQEIRDELERRSRG